LCRCLDARAAAYARQRCADAALPESETQAVIEATEIATALRAAPHDGDTSPQRSRHEMAGTADVAGEVAALERLARCYRRSSIVRAVVAQLEREGAPTELAEGMIG
ncbi:MAG TPA: DUF6545 domain-containing protein, partial [Chloroflexota bacterium]